MHVEKLAICAAAICAALLLGFYGCSGHDEHISGGVTDKTDPTAPTAIESRDIASFHASFYLVGAWSQDGGDRVYVFDVDERDGVLTAREASSGVGLPADEALLAALQDVIDAHGLASRNGTYRVTAGLPPEFTPCTLDVTYASGETLAFTEDGSPDLAWAQDAYLVFAQWFADQGDASLLPPMPAHGGVAQLSISYVDGGRRIGYGAVDVLPEHAVDGETHLLLRDVLDTEDPDGGECAYALFPDDYRQRLTEIFGRYDLRPFDRDSVLYGRGRTMVDADDAWNCDLQIHVDYDDGSWIDIDTSDPGDREMLRPLLDELIGYHESLFA